MGRNAPSYRGRRRELNRRLCALVGAFVLSLFAVTALASAAAGDYAKGRGTTTGARFSFIAQGTGAADRANGSWTHTFTSTDPNITVTGDVTCMNIVGNMAAIGGRITGFKPAGAAVAFGSPQGFIVNATDNAKPSGGLDLYTASFVSAVPLVCPTPFGFGSPVITGDVEIIPGP
jgi:hypothetical protein